MQTLFYDSRVVKIHDNKLITCFNKDTLEHTYYYYHNDEFYFDAALRMASNEFKNKYYEFFRNIQFKYLEDPKIILNVYDREHYMDNKYYLVNDNDKLSDRLKDAYSWRYRTADIILINKEIKFDE